MTSEMFRGKESLNRIELSRLVQDLLNFGVSGSLQLWGWGDGWMGMGGGGGGWVDGDGGWFGGAPTHVHTYAHACMRTHAHACVVNMIISCKWPPPYLGIPCDVICACVCMHAHACAHGWGTPSHHSPPPSTNPPPSGGNPRNHSKFNST